MVQKICVIEDDEGIQDILRIVLRNAGYETEVFSDGEAILQNNYTMPGLFLLDKQLLGFDGINICEYLKINEQTKNIPVIMMSAYPNVKELALNAGADDFIEKPFPISLLLKTIRTHLQKQATENITA